MRKNAFSSNPWPMPGLPLLQLKNEEVNNITPTYIYGGVSF